jgi:hypothetical protein
MGESGSFWPVLVCLWVASCRPVATVGFVTTDFVGWGVGLVYGWLGLLVSSTCLLCVKCLGFGPFSIIAVSRSLDGKKLGCYLINLLFVSEYCGLSAIVSMGYDCSFAYCLQERIVF